MLSLYLRPGLLGAALAALLLGGPARGTAMSPVAVPPGAAHATAAVSAPVAELMQWIARTANHQGRPYVVVDKRAARVWVFDAQHRLRASSAALLGLTAGDHEVADIRTRDVRALAKEARITPAGRFVTEPGVNLQGEGVVWLDYEAGLALHRVRPGLAQSARLQRLGADAASARRVSLGCVVLPVAVYEQVIEPLLGRQAGVVYVLPEHGPLSLWLDRWGRAAVGAG